jgi:hypothetical protein
VLSTYFVKNSHVIPYQYSSSRSQVNAGQIPAATNADLQRDVYTLVLWGVKLLKFFGNERRNSQVTTHTLYSITFHIFCPETEYPDCLFGDFLGLSRQMLRQFKTMQDVRFRIVYTHRPFLLSTSHVVLKTPLNEPTTLNFK